MPINLTLPHLNSVEHDDAAWATAVEQLHLHTAIYTAEGVVDDLLGRLRWPHDNARLIDPSCGDGMFLARALAKLLAASRCRDEGLPPLIEGWEIHPGACEQARARVAAVLIAHGRSDAAAHACAAAIVHNRDFLTDSPLVPTWDYIAGNPPYLRWVNVPKLLRDLYETHVPRYAAGDMLHSFLDRCASCLKEDGEIGFVTSDRWLFNLGAASLREAIGRTLSLRHVERLDVKTAFYRPKQRRAGTPPRIHPVAVVLGRGEGLPLSRAAIYPGVDNDQYAGMPTLGELAEVRIAPWLGTAGVFVVTAGEAAASGLPGDVLVPAVDTDDVVGDTVRTPTRFAIRTDPDTPPVGAVLAHLERARGSMAPRGQKGKFWMPPERFHKMDLSRPSLMVPRIAKTPKAVRVPSGVLPINHNLSIVTADRDRLAQIEQALKSPMAAEWVAAHAAPLENGYFSLTTTLLRKLPLER